MSPELPATEAHRPPDSHARAREIFLAAAELSIAARAAFVAARCGDDRGLCDEVSSLLEFHSDDEPVRPVWRRRELIADRFRLVDALVWPAGEAWRAFDLVSDRTVILSVDGEPVWAADGPPALIATTELVVVDDQRIALHGAEPFVDGSWLSHRLDDGQSWPEERVRLLMRDIAVALTADAQLAIDAARIWLAADGRAYLVAARGPNGAHERLAGLGLALLGIGAPSPLRQWLERASESPTATAWLGELPGVTADEIAPLYGRNPPPALLAELVAPSAGESTRAAIAAAVLLLAAPAIGVLASAGDELRLGALALAAVTPALEPVVRRRSPSRARCWHRLLRGRGVDAGSLSELLSGAAVGALAAVILRFAPGAPTAVASLLALAGSLRFGLAGALLAALVAALAA